VKNSPPFPLHPTKSDRSSLQFDYALDCVHGARELNEHAIAHEFDDANLVACDQACEATAEK
jgi:hypothetical protein